MAFPLVTAEGADIGASESLPDPALLATAFGCARTCPTLGHVTFGALSHHANRRLL
jgi:hypothetical protein